MSSKRIFLANVGANAAHVGMGLQSPRFSDGTFEFVTIPEEKALLAFKGSAADKYLVHYGDLLCFNQPGEPLGRYLAKRSLALPTHYDPDFEHFTYGDECEKNPRASALKQMQPGDLLFFLARLADYDNKVERFTGRAGFYLVGFLEIARIVAGVRDELTPEELRRIGHNAHVRRAKALPGLFYDGFYVFEGSARSQRFKVAPAFGRAEAERFLRDKQGREWHWNEERSPLQTIGSYTRACRCILDPARSLEEAERTKAFLDWLALKF